MNVVPRESSADETCPSESGCCTSVWTVVGEWNTATGCGVCQQTREIGCFHECLKKVADSYCACLAKPPSRRLVGCYNDCEYKWHIQQRKSCLGRDFKCAASKQAGCGFHPIPDGVITRWRPSQIRLNTITAGVGGHPINALAGDDEIVWDPRHPHCFWSISPSFTYDHEDSMGYTSYVSADDGANLPEKLVQDVAEVRKFFYYSDNENAPAKLDLSHSRFGGEIVSSSIPSDIGIKVYTSKIGRASCRERV